MTSRLLLLPVMIIVLWGLVPFSTGRAPIPKAARLPEARKPSPRELWDAQKDYEAIGGRSTSASHHWDEEISHIFIPPRPITSETLSKLPDLQFEYTLQLPIEVGTAPGTLKSLAHLHYLRSVEVVTDRSNRMCDITPLIAELGAVPNLERLDVYCFGMGLLTDDLAKELAAFPSLRHLSGEGSISDLGLEKLAQYTKLESLSFRFCDNITDEGLKHLAGMPNLSELSLQWCAKPTAKGIRHFIKEPRLIDLAIGGADMRGDVLVEVAKIKTLEKLNLTTLKDIAGIQPEQSMQLIARLPRLRELELSSHMIQTDAGLKELAAAPELTKVYLGFCGKVTDAGVKELTQVATLKSVIGFHTELLTDNALAMLGNMPRLESLHLDDSKKLTDRGMRDFVTARGDKLLQLGIPGHTVSDDFITSLAIRSPNLRELYLQQCKGVTDKSVPSLATLTKLRLLELSGTSITLAGATTLQQRLPDCVLGGYHPPMN